MIFLNDPQNVFHIKIDLPWYWIELALGVASTIPRKGAFKSVLSQTLR